MATADGSNGNKNQKKKKQNSFLSTENSENREISYTKCPTPDASVIRKAPENLHHILEKEGNKKEKKKGGNEKKFWIDSLNPEWVMFKTESDWVALVQKRFILPSVEKIEDS